MNGLRSASARARHCAWAPAFALVLSAALVFLGASADARPPARPPAAQPPATVLPTPPATPLPAAPGPLPPALPAAVPTAPPAHAEPGAVSPAAAAFPALAPAPPSAPHVPAPPLDPRLAQTFTIFETHCAQCHQTGKLTLAAPAGHLANILDLAELARTPHLVRRAEPDASRLYQVLLDRHKPLELGADIKWPDADDIQRVRTWIEELEPNSAACETQPKLTPAAIAQAIDAAVLAAGEAAGQELRFVSLAPFVNGCATAAEMEAYRQGVAKLLNSLSWGAQPVAPVAIDGAKAILSFKLSDIGWVDEHWNALARAEPKAFALDLSGLLAQPAANTRPIRGDWLALTASQAPYYSELLGLPPTLDETARLLGINRDPATWVIRPMRAGLRTSALTRGPRIIERDQADGRRFWLAYDFADGTGERDAFERPLGAIKGAPDKSQFRADGMRLIFGLPNGFIGFGLFEPDGHRIDQLGARLELDPSHSAGPTVAGLSCLSCHTAGLKPFTDQMRAHVASDKFTGPREVKDQVLALYETSNEWSRVLDEDSYRFRRSLIQAGIDPDLSWRGLEPLAALAAAYRQGVDLTVLAAEAGLTVEAINTRLATLTFPDRSLVQRLRQGVLERSEANTVLAALNAKPAPPADPNATLAAGAAFKLALWTDQAVYKPGELMTVFARPSAPCHLTLISLNAAGKATVLFPSEFDPDNLVRPETAVSVPDEKAHYQFRVKDPGRESIIGQCQTVAKFPAGIEPDYERQRFTVLGNYENFLKASYGQPAKPAPPRPGPATSPGAKPEQIARSAVSILIK